MQLLTKPELREQLLTARNELKQARADNVKYIKMLQKFLPEEFEDENGTEHYFKTSELEWNEPDDRLMIELIELLASTNNL